MFYRFLIISILSLLILIGCEEDSASSKEESSTTATNEPVNIVPVEALEIKEKIVEQKFPTSGVLIPNNSVDIVAEVSGKVISVSKELGDYLGANQTLAIIDDIIPESQFKQAEAQVLSTKSNLSIAEANLKSDKVLFENGDISELEYNNSQLALKNAESQYLSAAAALSAAKKSYDDTRIKSPISGFVSRKNIDFGSMVSMGTVVYRIVDLSNLKVKLSVPQEIINRVKLGGKAVIDISALNGNLYEGVVKRISPQADETTGGFSIEVLVNNKDMKIKAGMTAKVELYLSKENQVLAIPEYALVSKDEENYVYKINSDVAELVKVELGESIGENIIVESGLTAGDKIVIVGMKNLGIKTKINIEKLY
ncbi:MAG: efflux RND transporter periplasmic adaptor subunit [Ignavibacteriae bacterium]|nr:efflux RND transporter periplasmic adaptor subunit [Ignavibacteriota bacterium]